MLAVSFPYDFIHRSHSLAILRRAYAVPVPEDYRPSITTLAPFPVALPLALRHIHTLGATVKRKQASSKRMRTADMR